MKRLYETDTQPESLFWWSEIKLQYLALFNDLLPELIGIIMKNLLSLRYRRKYCLTRALFCTPFHEETTSILTIDQLHGFLKMNGITIPIKEQSSIFDTEKKYANVQQLKYRIAQSGGDFYPVSYLMTPRSTINIGSLNVLATQNDIDIMLRESDMEGQEIHIISLVIPRFPGHLRTVD